MKRMIISPLTSVGDLFFGEAREIVRQIINRDYTEIKKSSFAVNTMDVYDDFHLYYDERNNLAAIEFFANTKLVLNGKTIFPGKIRSAQKVITDFETDGECMISRTLSIGLTISSDGSNRIESILIGCAGYYK